MNWIIYHKRSEEYASRAEMAVKHNDLGQAMALYRLAAEQETLALHQLDTSKMRTLGITAVSAAALWYKAQDYHQAELVAYRALATDALPEFAVQQLKELLRAIWKEETIAV